MLGDFHNAVVCAIRPYFSEGAHGDLKAERAAGAVTRACIETSNDGGMMDRQAFLKTAGVVGAGALIAMEAPAAAKAGAGSRFDTTLKLTNSGMVLATGPTGFDPDELRGRFYAHVAQGDRVQAGFTGWTKGSSWSCLLGGPSLRPGPADAYGVVYIENRDGTYEWYPWEVAVTLR